MRSVSLALLPALLLALAGCVASRQTRIYQAGEKAAVEHLTYVVIDTQILPHLGDDPANPRVPQNRFLVVQVSISNSGNATLPIPAMTLVDDGGQTYNELPDGSGVPRWLGMVRKVEPGQTEQGNILFDAPAKHYKLKLTDETDPADVMVDIPLSFVHEQLNDMVVPETGIPAPAPTVPGKKQ
jgi:hypothetical protein